MECTGQCITAYSWWPPDCSAGERCNKLTLSWHCWRTLPDSRLQVAGVSGKMLHRKSQLCSTSPKASRPLCTERAPTSALSPMVTKWHLNKTCPGRGVAFGKGSLSELHERKTWNGKLRQAFRFCSRGMPLCHLNVAKAKSLQVLYVATALWVPPLCKLLTLITFTAVKVIATVFARPGWTDTSWLGRQTA